MEGNGADAARGDINACDGIIVLVLPMLGAPAVKYGSLDLPDHHLAVLAGGGDDGVVEG